MKQHLMVLLGWILLSSTGLPAQVPSNSHPFRIGADQGGANVFQGRIASAGIYDRVLTADELKTLAKGEPAATGTVPGAIAQWVLTGKQLASTPTEMKFDFSRGRTLAAWLSAQTGSTGRIIDKITPGGSDGILLDILPGNTLRLICGSDILKHPLPRTGQWIHVAGTINEEGVPTLHVNGARVAGGAVERDGVTFFGPATPPGDPLTLWYRRPAAAWTGASVIGNGRLGGMVWGGVRQERIDLNEDSLWSGEPYDNLNPKGLKSLPEIRRLLVEGKHKEAKRLVEQDMNGRYNQSYMPLGDLKIDFPVSSEVTDYRRELDLSQAVARVRFQQDGATFTREVFASQPAQAIVIRLAADKPGKVSFSATLGCQLRHSTTATAGYLRLTGRCPAHVDPNYVANGKVIYDEAPDGKGMRFETRLAAVNEGGRIVITDNALTAEGCNSVTLLLVAATSYNGPHKSPSKEGKDPSGLCDGYLALSSKKSYAELLAAHVADHQGLFNRVKLDLGQADTAVPTDVRLKQYEPGRDPGLAALYYQFGRYLLIASSRPGTQPANLQGIWNHQIRPPWSANWTL